MNGQRDEKDILSTPKRKKHHIDYTHINKNEQKAANKLIVIYVKHVEVRGEIMTPWIGF